MTQFVCHSGLTEAHLLEAKLHIVAHATLRLLGLRFDKPIFDMVWWYLQLLLRRNVLLTELLLNSSIAFLYTTYTNTLP